jgi:hypothetical protein
MTFVTHFYFRALLPSGIPPRSVYIGKLAMLSSLALLRILRREAIGQGAEKQDGVDCGRGSWKDRTQTYTNGLSKFVDPKEAAKEGRIM